jgi:signal transduction histidine kinase/CheY-like chemotaxis protein/CHASE3 domain sensor protein
MTPSSTQWDIPSSNGSPRSDLSHRLVIALLTPVLLLILVGALLAVQITRMSDDSRWVDHSDQVIGEIHRLEAEVLQQESSLRGFLVTGDLTYLQGYGDARPRDAIATLRTLVADNTAQESRVDAVERGYDGWLLQAEAATRPEMREEQKKPANMEIRRRRHADLLASVTGVLAAELDLRYARTAAAAASRSVTRLAFVLVFGGMALTLAFLSRRQLEAIARRYRAALEVERASRVALEDQDWVRARHLSLSDAMQGDFTLDQLTERILKSLGEHAEADIGAMFTMAEGAWTRRASFGMDPTAGAQTFAPGAGLVGRAAHETRLIRLQNVPGDYLKVRSGTGERSPAEIVVLPAQTERKVLAVIELGFLRPVTLRSLDLIGRVAESVAAAVRSTEYKARLRELLEQSRAQAQELRTQEEELRVANEELESQRDAVSAAHAQLERRQEELQSFNARLEEQASELASTKDAVVEKAREAERASRYKSQFLANMSHELRTPLNSSLILAKLLADNREGNLTEEQVRFARTIYSSGHDLLTLIGDILDLSKIEAGKVELQIAQIDLARLAESLAHTCEPMARDKGIAFSIAFDPSAPPSIATDAQRLEQILRNLLSNALKFTDKGAVSLRISVDGANVQFAVRDSGIGIAPDHQSTIFEAFHQVDGTSRRKFGGTGLGLSISRDMARLLGGTLGVQSEPGRGSIFTLTLPRTLGSAALRPIEPPAVVAPPERLARAPVSLRAVAASVVADDRDHVDPARRLVLVVEDDAAFAQILVDLAHELHFQCIVAHESDSGIALAMQYSPSAVILDVHLPDHSGLSVLDRLKRSPMTRHIPVHIVSIDDYSHAALSMGAAGYLMKPVTREALAEAFHKIEELLSRQVRRLLVIEDDPVQRDSLTRLLRARDVEIVGAGSIREALASLAASTFDCVVTDLTLPDGSGFELLARMAEDSGYPFPPVIVYTGTSLSAEQEQTLRRYSSSIIVKGARSPERLLDEVTLFLHQVESELPPEQQRLLERERDRETLFDGRRILIVEDDVRNIYALSSVLEPKGAEISIARNGREAIDVLERTADIDLVLMDIMMPEMDGMEATRAIRKRAQWAKLPIIALTAKAMKDDQDKCREAGANDYISKPLDVDKFLSLLRVWMPK